MKNANNQEIKNITVISRLRTYLILLNFYIPRTIIIQNDRKYCKVIREMTWFLKKVDDKGQLFMDKKISMPGWADAGMPVKNSIYIFGDNMHSICLVWIHGAGRNCKIRIIHVANEFNDHIYVDSIIFIGFSWHFWDK